MKRRAALKTGLAFGAGVLILRRAEAQGATLNLYSARHYNTDEALYGNFADLTVCTFWLAPNTPVRPYLMRARTTQSPL